VKEKSGDNRAHARGQVSPRLWISNVVILLGAEFNAEMARGRQIEAGDPEDHEPFLEPRDTRKLKS